MTEKKMHWDDPKLHQIAGDFFRLFSCFEYSLKANGFLIPNKRNAEADWTKFADEIDAALGNLENAELKKAITFLLAEPPKKQINRNGRLEWDTTPPNTKNRTDLILQYVRRVRNNLFHGGKFSGHWFEADRSGALIDACIKILNACLQISEKIYEAYNS